MNNNKKDLLHQSFTGIKKYGKEFIEYTKEVEADADCISRKRVEDFIKNINTMLDSIEEEMTAEK